MLVSDAHHISRRSLPLSLLLARGWRTSAAHGDCEAKFWLQPVVLARNYGLPSHEIARIIGLIEEHENALIAAWEEFHGKR